MNEQIIDAVNAIGRTGSHIEKVQLLRNAADIPDFKAVMRFIYNPYCKTGISEAKLLKGLIESPDDTAPPQPIAAVIEYFTKHQTGTLSDAMYAATYVKRCSANFGPGGRMLAQGIVKQDLKIGVTAASLNEAYGSSFIPKVGCMLGTLLADVPAQNVHWPCVVTEKLDGIRRVLIKDKGVIRMYSRSGHPDEGLVEIIDDAQYLPDNFVYDGELLATGTFKDNIALRQATNSIANSKGIRTGLTFNVFDMVPVDDFYAGCCALPAIARKVRLGATLMDESISYIDEDFAQHIAAFGIYRDLKAIKPVPILGIVNNMDEAAPIASRIWKAGGEGIMLNTVKGKYEIKRSKELLKVKHTEEHVLVVTDFMEGSGKYEDSLGALVCEYIAHNGDKCYVGVGSGFTDAQREHIWNNQMAYRGQRVEVECFGESTNAQGFISLNCPIFLRFTNEEHE